ncbi:MAG: hypothetical protein ACREMY_15990, partial [bacterium]
MSLTSRTCEPAVRKLVGGATVVATSAIAYTETRAALARRHRDRTLRGAAFATTKKAFESDWPKCLTVEETAALGREAGECAE